jgi:hypothetical protein
MTLFHLKIHRILNFPSGSLLFEVRYSGNEKPKEYKCSGLRSRTLSKIWNLSVPNYENNYIEIIAKTKRMFHKSVEFGRMIIPLGMIRPNTVLNDWFLIRKRSILDIPLLIELSLHHNCSNEVQFSPYPLQIVSFYGTQPSESMFVRPFFEMENVCSCIPIYDQSNNNSQSSFHHFDNL